MILILKQAIEKMKINRLIRIVYFTENGKKVAKRLKESFLDYLFEEKDDNTDLLDFVGEAFKYHLPMVFVGATGIAVRTIAPFVSDKLSDSPVIVIDELGINVIPILSGHFGMANDLAKEFSKGLDANCVITTATDINNVFSVDSFAVKEGYRIVDKNQIKVISSKALMKEKIAVETKEDGVYFDDRLMLIPKELVIGMGCKKDKDFSDLLDFLLEDYSEKELRDNLYAICSIDVKAKEKGLLKLAAYLGAKFITFSAEELNDCKGQFEESDFVKAKVGVGNVSERAVACLGATILKSKEARDGMTKTIGKRSVGTVEWQEKFSL